MSDGRSGFKRVNVTAQTADGTRTVQAVGCGNFAVHEDLRFTSLWAITHRRTGRQVAGKIRSEHAAVEAARQLDMDAELWNFDEVPKRKREQLEASMRRAGL